MYRRELVDKSLFWKWASTNYWALQTLTTVGYGDQPARTMEEICLAIGWMIVGVGYYSFLVGNISSSVQSQFRNPNSLQFRLRALHAKKENGELPKDLWFDIHVFLLSNHDESFGRDNEKLMIRDLPLYLKDQVMSKTFEKLLNQNKMLKKIDDCEFLISFLQHIDYIRWDKDQMVYREGDIAESFFMIESGSVRLFSKLGEPFATYTEGDTFGESDLLTKGVRDSKAVAMEPCFFFRYQKQESSSDLFLKYPQQFYRLQKEAKKKRSHHLSLIKKLDTKIQILHE